MKSIVYMYENCDMAIAISSSRADSASVPGVADTDTAFYSIG